MVDILRRQARRMRPFPRAEQVLQRDLRQLYENVCQALTPLLLAQAALLMLSQLAVFQQWTNRAGNAFVTIAATIVSSALLTLHLTKAKLPIGQGVLRVVAALQLAITVGLMWQWGHYLQTVPIAMLGLCLISRLRVPSVTRSSALVLAAALMIESRARQGDWIATAGNVAMLFLLSEFLNRWTEHQLHLLRAVARREAALHEQTAVHEHRLARRSRAFQQQLQQLQNRLAKATARSTRSASGVATIPLPASMLDLGIPPFRADEDASWEEPFADEATTGPIFDRDLALERVLGSERLLGEILQIVIAAVPRLLDQVHQATAKQDPLLLQAALRSLRGSLSTVTTGRPYLLVRELETRAGQVDWEQLTEPLNVLDQLIHHLLGELENAVSISQHDSSVADRA